MNSDNQQKNKDHYDRLYNSGQVKNILHWINNVDAFLKSASTTEPSWFAIYKNNFKDKLPGKKILEMGCGDCTNAAVMAALGAEVYANDIADSSGEIIELLNQNFEFKHPIKFIAGDFIENNLEADQFDFVIGKAFLHHLELPLEEKFLRETGRLLKIEGEARFFEPAVNSRFIDAIRWHIPVGNRPSKLNKRKFREWKLNDPHPDRTFSSSHFENAGKKFFQEVEIHPIGTLERFSRILKWGNKQNKFKRWALNAETFLPSSLNKAFTRSQLIIYRKPL
ncbi:class I SAM-dependent methyltransferase [Antarcticibacterium flavum]|uniref:Class I SAM-dependent methyltransferase n=1 Tax=Antarcticibacterium flavum TaxID=2058175 RepID=A0A5B7X5U2_9FLAO|nr:MULTISPECIES: class I SAM-dependent methyltransferase [Antarcticibacterium]MCM4161418.1 class I SAM-dependent methyltransferase [Antarcticibacterium sp. W02-3]QCY70560.1 class I SAM-dependent methyltransferase [Antarcticibacterium flavum]